MQIFKNLLVTGSSAVLGSALKKISLRFKSRNFIFLTSKDCDLTNYEVTLKTFKKIKPDAVIHLAAVSGGIGLLANHPASIMRDINAMTFNVLESVRILEIPKAIMTLTTGMYPPEAKMPYDESDIHNGYPSESTYGSSFAKRLIDPAIRAYRQEYGMNIIGLIPSGIFGGNDNFHQDHAPMLPSLIRRFYENKDNDCDLIVWGDGSPLREYTYSEDLAKIYMWALDNYKEEQCLNIGTVEENSVKNIAFMVAKHMGINEGRIKFDITKPKGVFRKNTSNKRFVQLSNFKYTSFEEGLKKTILWFAHEYESNKSSIRTYSKSKE